MFTGIVRGLAQIKDLNPQPGLLRYSVELAADLLAGLETGASISVDGCCQTVVKIEGRKVWFDAIQETLRRTTYSSMQPEQWVNIERSAKFGDEIGGHVLSGHIYGKAQIVRIDDRENTKIITLQFQPEFMKYFFSKGYIALDGVSLTLVDVLPSGTFTVHLIPETVRLTTFGKKKVGNWVNVELDSQTQTIVETVERILEKKG